MANHYEKDIYQIYRICILKHQLWMNGKQKVYPIIYFSNIHMYKNVMLIGNKQWCRVYIYVSYRGPVQASMFKNRRIWDGKVGHVGERRKDKGLGGGASTIRSFPQVTVFRELWS